MGKDFSSAFKKAANAKQISEFAKNIGLGRHTVALKAFRGKESQKNKEVFVEGEFVILKSHTETEQVGATRGWAWFINASGWTGDYASARLQTFLDVARDAIAELLDKDEDGNLPDLESFGSFMSNEEDNPCYGLVLECEVVQVFDDAGNVRKGKNGREIHNVVWEATPQTLEDIESTRELIGSLVENFRPEPVKKPAVASAKTGSGEAKPAATTSMTKTGAVRSLLGRK